MYPDARMRLAMGFDEAADRRRKPERARQAQARAVEAEVRRPARPRFAPRRAPEPVQAPGR
jgi:hypothetical protein